MEAGVVTLASVMVNGAAAEAGIQLARERGFLGRLGLHLNLTEGRPLLGAAEVPSLLLAGGDADQEGTGLGGPEPRFRGKFGFREACDAVAVVAAEAAAERARSSWFEEHVGRPAARSTATSTATSTPPSARRSPARAAAGARTRDPGGALRPRRALRAVRQGARRGEAAAAVRRRRRALRRRLRRPRPAAAATRRASSRSGARSSRAARSCEVMVHPGYRAAGRRRVDGFDADARREGELRTLCTPSCAPPSTASRGWRRRPRRRATRRAAAPKRRSASAAATSSCCSRRRRCTSTRSTSCCSRRSPTRWSRATACSTTAAAPASSASSPSATAPPTCASLTSTRKRRAAAANAAAAGYERGRQWCASRGDLDDKPPKSVRFADLVQFADVDVVLCNPPQMPGPEALAAARPDKYGGADGAHFYRRLAAHGAALLGDGGRIVFLQTSFSSFAAVDALFGAAGFGVRTLKTQKRSAARAAIDALAPGCADWLLDHHPPGGAHGEEGVEGDDGARTLVYEQRLAVATRE